MSSLSLPVVDQEAVYDFHDPFSHLTLNWTRFTCTSIRRLGQLTQANENPWKTLYQHNQLPYEAYQRDVANDTYILELTTPTKSRIYVPFSYIKSINSSESYSYQDYAISIKLDALPTTINLAPLLDEILDLVKDQLGITATGRVFELLETPLHLSPHKHRVREKIRELVQIKSPSYRLRYRQALDENEKIRATRDAVETYLLNCLRCSTCGRDQAIYDPIYYPVETGETLWDAALSYIQTPICHRPDDNNAIAYQFMAQHYESLIEIYER